MDVRASRCRGCTANRIPLEAITPVRLTDPPDFLPAPTLSISRTRGQISEAEAKAAANALLLFCAAGAIRHDFDRGGPSGVSVVDEQVYDLASYDLTRYDLARYGLARYKLARYKLARY